MLGFGLMYVGEGLVGTPNIDFVVVSPQVGFAVLEGFPPASALYWTAEHVWRPARDPEYVEPDPIE